jgi:fumarate reductase subunit C
VATLVAYYSQGPSSVCIETGASNGDTSVFVFLFFLFIFFLLKTLGGRGWEKWSNFFSFKENVIEVVVIHVR